MWWAIRLCRRPAGNRTFFFSWDESLLPEVSEGATKGAAALYEANRSGETSVAVGTGGVVVRSKICLCSGAAAYSLGDISRSLSELLRRQQVADRESREKEASLLDGKGVDGFEG